MSVPLFIEELTKTLLESGVLKEERHNYVLSSPLTATTIPATLHDSLMARLDRLASVKEIAQFAAAIGREFSLELLVPASGLSRSAVESHLNELVKAELMFRRGTPPRVTFIFKHALVRDAAYESLLYSKRVEFHARLADSIESYLPDLGTNQPELLAHHWSRAERPREASYYWLAAGHRANEQSASIEAESHLRHGLEAIQALEPSENRDRRELELQIALGNALMAMKGYGSEEVGVVYRRALDLCEELSDTENRIPVQYGLWANLFSRLQLTSCLDLSGRLIDISAASEDIVSKMQGHRLHAFGLLHMGDVEESLIHADIAIDLYDPQHHSNLAYVYSQDPRVATLMCHTWAHWHLGRPDQSLKAAQLSVKYAEELDHPHSIAYAHAWCLSRAHLLRREPDEALKSANQGIEVATEYEFPLHRAQALVGLAAAHSIMGDTQAALSSMEAAMKDYERTGARLQRVMFMSLCAEVFFRAGRLDSASDALDEAQRAAEENSAYWWAPEIWRLRGTIMSTQNSLNVDQAERCFQQAYEIAVSQKGTMPALRALTSLVALIPPSTKRTSALERLATTLESVQQHTTLPDILEARALL